MAKTHTDPIPDLAGPGGIRYASARWRIEGTIRTLSPVHLGGGRAESVDMSLVRDRVTGRPLLTGASLAGALRESLCSTLVTEETLEAPRHEVQSLFGGVREDDNGAQSPLVVFDAVADEAETVEIRDAIHIEATTGVAQKHFKYDFEVWPAGQTFPVRMDLLVPPVSNEADVEAKSIALLIHACLGFDTAVIRLGAKGRRGLGRCKVVDWRARRFALGTDADGWRTWLATGLAEAPIRLTGVSYGSLTEAIVAAWSLGANAVHQAVQEIQRAAQPAGFFDVRIPIAFPGGVLIGSPQDNPTGADVRHLGSAGKPVISGTSLGGTLRQQARRIADQVHGHAGPFWVDALFGSEPKKADGPVRRLFASRVSIEEVEVTRVKNLQTTRIQLDGFTQAPKSGALLQEEPAYGQATLQLRLRLPKDEARSAALKGLLMLVIKDLALGDVAIGGTTGIGRGAVRIAGPIGLTDQAAPLTVSPNAPPSDVDRARIEAWVHAFRTSTLGRTQPRQ